MEIVSCPPDKICSTATADPANVISHRKSNALVENSPGIEKTSQAKR